ncbi:alpha/beta hydrolase [Ancylobacter sp. IITR112]|uniref:alpha/beta hydrolase n=1 Tax=Ancylobacter sp. IITR112 TaxID=3138073 RepID=UPI00352BA34A
MLRRASRGSSQAFAWLLALVLVAPVLAGCAGRPGPDALTVIENDDVSISTHTLLVASARARDPRPGVFYSGERTPELSFAKIEVSVPPTHKPGMVEAPTQSPPNPATDMVVREAEYRETPKEFSADLQRELAKFPAGRRQAVIFVHGYNTLFSEALYRLTQMAEDSKATGVPVLFTWASRGEISDYVYDNNSATAARDRLEETIRLVFASGADQVSIVAHSMGNWVTVEALRQIQISGKRLPVEKIGNIVLAAPDIDVDVFKSQLKRFGKPPKPFLVIVSSDDKALAFSDFIAGDKPRLGAYTHDTELVELGAIVVDMSNVKSLDGFNHAKFAQLAELAPELRGMIARAAQQGDAKVDLAGIRVSGLDRARAAAITAGLPVVPVPASASARNGAPALDTSGAVVSASAVPQP